MQDTQVQSLCWEDPLEEEMAIHSSILVWRIPWTEGPGRLQSWGRIEQDTTEHAHIQHTITCFFLLRFLDITIDYTDTESHSNF